jgi:DNA-binding NtrC family response regulator
METVLIVDDDKDMQFNLSNILKDEGYEVIAVGDGKRALKEVKMRFPDIVLLDIRLPKMDGMKILEEMKKINKDLMEIMITAYGDIKDAVKAMKLGAFDYITKPFNNEELILTIKKALQSQYLSREVESLRKSLWEKTTVDNVIGESPQIKHVLKQVKIVAPTNMTVILQGESGTGKELIAQMIHQNSLRKDKPFIGIDCGAIPETLVESELFGYEKGAFTGADARKEGKFEQANEGTLLLDEVTNLPEAAQVKLLRVIQERRLQHLGGKKDIKVDVRIVVATNTNLSEAVRAGKFRADLFHRLNEFHITLPALRERKEDIPILAKYFLDEANQELNKKVKGFSTKAMKLLLDYHWPGNVRELKNVIKKAVLLTETEDILPAHLSIDIKPQNEFKLEKHLSKGASFKDIIRKVETDLIRKALEEAGNSKTKTAKILHMNRRTLYRKMKSFGLPPHQLLE